MRVVAVHLLNDYSGSPKVLMQLLKSWTKNHKETHLFTCSGRIGFLSNIADVKEHFFWYKFAKNPLLRLLFLITSQFILGTKLLFFLKKSDVLYVNTVLPFGAAIAGKMRGCKVIYHIHETSVKPKILKDFLFGVSKTTAEKVVYVSQFLAEKEPIVPNYEIVYNVLESDFVEQAKPYRKIEKPEKIVLMVCSLKAYKGVDQFLKLANLNPEYTFKLVVNASQEEINAYFVNENFPTNFQVFPTQKDTQPFYREASVVLNLSDINLWVETFGLTVLEGMTYGLPAIVPPIGGITELVDNYRNGFRINSIDINRISDHLHHLLDKNEVYAIMSNHAIQKSELFSEKYFEQQSLEIISN